MVSETTPMVLAEGHTTRWLWTILLLVDVLQTLTGADVEDRIKQAATDDVSGADRGRAVLGKSISPCSR